MIVALVACLFVVAVALVVGGWVIVRTIGANVSLTSASYEQVRLRDAHEERMMRALLAKDITDWERRATAAELSIERTRAANPAPEPTMASVLADYEHELREAGVPVPSREDPAAAPRMPSDLGGE